ncbi:MAG: hypothetical protein GXP47_10535 [Acidobacteria bacterium]|nr:hypothetical protein [Acidobacteriota bacterium]
MVVFTCAVAAAAKSDEPSFSRLDRLRILADVWGNVQLFHPAVVMGWVDWEQALVEAIPPVEAAATPQAFVAALDRHLLAKLGDPFTRARIDSAQPEEDDAPPIPMEGRMLTPDVGVITMPDPRTMENPDFLGELGKLAASLQKARILLLDLRWQRPLESYDYGPGPLVAFFLKVPIRESPLVSRSYQGWAPATVTPSYLTPWKVRPGASIVPISSNWTARRRYPGTDFKGLPKIEASVVFLLNNRSASFLNRSLDGLERTGQASVIWQRTGTSGAWSAVELTYPHGIRFQLHTEFALGGNGRLGLQVNDVADDPLAGEELIRRVRTAAKRGHRTVAASGRPFDFQVHIPPRRTAAATLSRGQRLLGLFKMWTVIGRFFPNLEYASADWPSVLDQWIPRVENVQTVFQYYDVLRQLAALLNDSHVRVYHRTLLPGWFVPRFDLRRVEGKVIVTALHEEAPPELRAGDEVVALDGTDVEEVDRYWRKRISASTEGRRQLDIWSTWAVMGKHGTELRITVRRGTKRLDVIAHRARSLGTAQAPEHEGGPVLRLAGGLGYIDLTRIASSHALELALRKLHDAPGLVLDLRGYPRFGLSDELTGRLTDRPTRSPRRERPMIDGLFPLYTGWDSEQHMVKPVPGEQYERPVVVLIDARTLSSAEDTCIYLTDTGRVTFVGSTTAGADGYVVSLMLPGGGTMPFTARRVTFADGRRFEGVGIVPDVEAHPSIAGIMAGRDEVLERGVGVLQKLISANQR